MVLEYLMLELKMGGKKEDIKSIFNVMLKWKNCIKLILLLLIELIKFFMINIYSLFLI